nr:unnamed protein product [Digitaria exilis]
MAAAAFPSTTSLRTPEPHSRGRLLSLDEASSSSCSTSGCAESSAVACKGGGEAEEGLLDLDCPWVAEAEAESRLEAAAAVLEGLGFCAEDGHEEEEAEIRDNQLRQEDELMALEAIYGDDLVVFENKGGLRYFQIYIRYDVADGVEGPWHPGKQCLTPEQKIQLRKASGRMTEREVAQELLNIRQLYKDVRLCPGCRMAIAKTEGESGCKLFGAREIAEWERQLEAMQPEGQMRIAMSPIGATVRCPKCRARNFKEDERYIFCWACRASYCTLCRRKVENKKTGHYGSPECMGLDNIDF